MRLFDAFQPNPIHGVRRELKSVCDSPNSQPEY